MLCKRRRNTLNILIVNMSVDPVSGGGTVERTRKLARELQLLPGTNAKILSSTAGLDPESCIKDPQFILLPCLSERWYIPKFGFGTVYKALQWADVVIIMGHWTLLNAVVYMANKWVRRPYLFCPAGALHIFGRSIGLKYLYNVLVGNAMIRNASRMIAIPKDEAKLFYKLGVQKEKVAIIPNGISPEDFLYTNSVQFKTQHSIGNFPFVLFMGRLNEIKGPDILLQSFVKLEKKYPEWHLVFAGPDGGMEEELQKAVVKSNIKGKVHFIGFVSGEEKSEAYHAASILVVPSRLEAMSIVALEAGICATPVIMTDQCGFSELVEAGGGLEVPVSAVSLSNALEELMKDEIRVQDMGMKAQRFIRAEYTWNHAARQHRDLCDDVCNKNGKVL